MDSLVSVIIPCFNADKWLREAIDSVLHQTYPLVEVIVIDDGSTDYSLDIIKSYGSQIIWEAGPNRGGNYARNRGLMLAKGDLIQYLDADDYLLPAKLARQVAYLHETGADVVYGDWRHKYHLPDGTFYEGEVKLSGDQNDILESLLEDWWVSPACILFRRKSVEASGGWDEKLKAAQDRDFFISVVMSGATVVYQPGCHSIYRRYGSVTISTSSKTRYLESHLSVLVKIEQALIERGDFTPKYKRALAQSYFSVARRYLDIDPSLYHRYINRTLELSPQFQAKRSDRTFLFEVMQKTLGFQNTERVVVSLKRLNKLLSSLL
ncbi:MAG: glycosyltransferase [Cyanobacteria bacterium P01_F01_bin.150]